MGEVVAFLIVVAIIAVVGVGFGRVVAAPAIRRLADRADEDADEEDAGDRPA